MATYRQLLLSTGGGVISESQQDEQNNCATIAIGLGGTGVACLRNLKRQIYSRLQPDDPNSPIPEYSHIRFLAVDTDKNSLGSDGAFNSLDKTTEFFDISTGDIHGLLSNTKALAGQPECKWLKTGLSILSATAAAGGVRQVGRLLMIEKSAEFVSCVQGMVEEATRGLPDDHPEVIVHIFTGIGGGTGSGIYLDVCYLVQEALGKVASKDKATTFGYVFLPDVNLSSPGIDPGSTTARYIKANGFAAMKELDYCMNFQNNHGAWDQEYQGFHIGPTHDKPTKVCHLISAHDVKGKYLQNGFAYAMNVVSDFVMQFLVKTETLKDNNTSEDANAFTTGNALTIESHVGNYDKHKDLVTKEAGASYGYCLLGASNAIVPMKEITTYLSSRLFEEMSRGSSRRPTDAEVDQFAEKNGLTFEQLLDTILSGTSYQMPAIDIDYKMFPTMDESKDMNPTDLVLPDAITNPYEGEKGLQSSMVGKIATNKDAMTNDWSPNIVQKDQQSVSKVCAVFFSLREVVIDPKRGPFYAADMLNGSQTKNLVNHLRGVQDRVEELLESDYNNVELRRSEVKKARHKYVNEWNPLAKKARFEAFIVAVSHYYTNDSHIKVLEQMRSMLAKMIKQFINLYDDHFMIYQSVSRNLYDTFHENYRTLSTSVLTEAIADPFILPLMKIEDMRESLDEMVNSMKMGIQAQNFHMFLFDKHEIWGTGDEHKISKEVSDYLVNVFHEYTNKSLTDYLEMRFNTSDPAKLANLVYNNIMDPLNKNAEALFWNADSEFNISKAASFGYISVPDSASIIISAAGKLIQAQRNLTGCPSKMKDRIFLLKCICGVPMFAFKGLSDCRREYQNDRTVGKHLYELTELDERDWRKLPNLQPFSRNANVSPKMEEDSAIYDQALTLGIIRENSQAETRYEIVVWPSIDHMAQNADAVIEAKDVQAMNRLIEEIERYKAERQPVRTVPIPNDGASGHEAKVRKDHVMASWEMLDLIRKEVEKLSQLEELSTRLETAKQNVGQGMMKKENFFHGLYSGVITVNIPKIFYLEDTFGITKETVLSEPSMEPCGMFVPLYQAYLTYINMPDADRAKLDQMTKDRLNDYMGTGRKAMQDSCDRLLQFFSDKYMGVMQAQAQKLPESTQDIINLLLKFRQGIEDFKVQYGLE